MLKFHLSEALQARIVNVIQHAPFGYIQPNRVRLISSTGSKTRAHARIYAFPRVFQEVLGIEPVYIIEIISEKFNQLSKSQQDKVLIHELLHIPKTFSGALVPHNCFGKKINDQVEAFYQKYQQNLGL